MSDKFGSCVSSNERHTLETNPGCVARIPPTLGSTTPKTLSTPSTVPTHSQSKISARRHLDAKVFAVNECKHPDHKQLALLSSSGPEQLSPL
ncbi:hypothetical protein H257_17525 [Aphanomyces astaci]|uniref:Uncharacterized protein n=1 Tax=Aphanomyces astaci TaxID=112090 RepID=W4FG90_APHAT|nr:hypothetical protein H257_17525 [Aphanomyces astaci]ETV65884.1 hypothetical protein H257_17525 [Aphanomyces astaci]|eukprot:XP_009844637.1 hypothetical protein H257_17525 [Aphanomyces astaci]